MNACQHLVLMVAYVVIRLVPMSVIAHTHTEVITVSTFLVILIRVATMVCVEMIYG